MKMKKLTGLVLSCSMMVLCVLNVHAESDLEQQIQAAKAEYQSSAEIYKTVYAVSDESKPAGNGKLTAYTPVIPEAAGAKITYDGGNSPYGRQYADQLNATGTVTPILERWYYYDEGGYTVGTTGEIPGRTPVNVVQKAVEGKYVITASWIDRYKMEQSINLHLNILDNSIYWNTDQWNKWLKKTVSEIISDNMSWAQKAEAITNYVSRNFAYGTSTTGYGMLESGSGSCWASADMVSSLGASAGFDSVERSDNFLYGMGNQHVNTMLHSPDGHYYECEAGYQREKGQMDGRVTEWPANSFFYDKTEPVYTYGFLTGGADDITDTIGRFEGFAEETVYVPTDESIKNLGNDDSVWFSDGPFYPGDFLKTVVVGKNITHIALCAYTHSESSNEDNDYGKNDHAHLNSDGDLVYDNAFKFVVDKNNPVYASDQNGALYLKNDDGTLGERLYYPSDRNYARDTSEVWQDTSDDERNEKAEEAFDSLMKAEKAYAESRSDSSDNSNSEGLAVYRLYNKSSDEHLYTCDYKEYLTLVELGWNSEGVVWIAPKSSKTPIIRLNNNVIGGHVYTTDMHEVNVLTDGDWVRDNVSIYSDDAKSYRIYRLYNTITHQHLLTIDMNEVNVLTSKEWTIDWNAEIYALRKIITRSTI